MKEHRLSTDLGNKKSSAGGVVKVLVIDISGTNVKVLATGRSPSLAGFHPGQP